MALGKNDSSMKALVEAELEDLKESLGEIESEIEDLIVPADNSTRAVMEIRAGAGGDEAGIFAQELAEMYKRFCQLRGYLLHSESFSEGASGLREAVFSIEGRQVWSQLRYEIGVHRVQRIPQTDPQGRIHTSTVTVALFRTDSESNSAVSLSDRDLRIDTFKSSGPGGQHVNKTNSAVRVTHLPTGLQVAVQEERCQQMNKARAIQILRERLGRQQQQRLVEEKQQERHLQVLQKYNFSHYADSQCG